MIFYMDKRRLHKEGYGAYASTPSERDVGSHTLHKKGVWGQNASIGYEGRLRLHIGLKDLGLY